MPSLRTTLALGAALALLAQGVASLAFPPNPGMQYSGTSGDVINNSLLVVGCLFLGGFLLLSARSAERLVVTELVAAGVGALLISASTLATVAAGEERWDGAYVAGFVLSAIGYVVAMVGTRSWTFGALLLGIILALAFFASAGSLALGGAVLLVLWDPNLSAADHGSTHDDQHDRPVSAHARPSA